MTNFKKLKLNKIKDFLNKIMRKLAEHSFMTFFIFFIISIALGALIFFQYSVLTGSAVEKKGEQKTFQQEANAYKNIKDEWARKKEIFSRTEKQQYSNPFLH